MMKTVEMERENLVEFTVGNDTGKILKICRTSQVPEVSRQLSSVTDQTVRLSRSQIRYKVP
jgi:hypothetical protein